MKIYSTYDLNLASTLLTLGYKLIEIDKENIKKCKFIFQYKKVIEQSANDYWDDKIILPAKTLFANQKTCKNRIYTDA
jgi:hypothetical protein